MVIIFWKKKELFTTAISIIYTYAINRMPEFEVIAEHVADIFTFDVRKHSVLPANNTPINGQHTGFPRMESN